MGKSASDLVTLVRQKCSIENSQVATDAEIVSYLNEALRALFDLVIAVDSSYYERTRDYTLASSPTGAVASLPGDIYKLRTVLRYPDTTREYPTFLVPMAERRMGKIGYTLDGDRITIVPWSIAGDGPWRVVYTPKAPQFRTFTVTYCTAATLPGYSASGSGAGKTLTGGANAILAVDGTNVANGDIVLVNTVGAHAATDTGMYFVVDRGSVVPGSPYILQRVRSYDDSAEIQNGDLFSIAAGSTLANTRQAVQQAGLQVWTSTSVIDVDPLPISATTSTLPLTELDVTLDNFDEYVTNKAALAIFAKRQMDPGLVPGLFAAAENRVKGMAQGRTAEPEQAPIMWRGRRRYSPYDDYDETW
jgi:hypothetical protein